MKGRVLVTGGAGFIGSHVVDRFVNEDYSVSVIDNLSTGKLTNISGHVKGEAVDFVKADILDRDEMSKCVRGVDIVVHLAAIVSVQFSIINPTPTYRINVEGTRRLLKSCVSNGVKRFIFISSCSVYGAPRYLPIDEKHPTNPISPYASSKLEGECLCKEFSNRWGLETGVLRLFNVYGPRQTTNEYSGVITKFMEYADKGEPLVIYGDGAQTRDFVHVTDVADVVATLAKGYCAEEIFNIGCGRAVSINDLAKKVMSLACRSCGLIYEPANEGDILHSIADTSKAEKAFGYAPKIGLEEGLQDLFVYIRNRTK